MSRAAAAVALALGLTVWAGAARAERLSLTDRSWNGLSELMTIARGAASRVVAPTRIEVGKLDESDALLIVHPEQPLPVSELAAFLRKGGRLAIADDFGRAELLLRAFGIGRHDVDAKTKAATLRGNRGLLLATPRGKHALSRGVVALASNHAQVLYHPELVPVFAFGPGSAGALVLTGAVGSGRLVAVSDSSVLINNMIELDDNRLFARNLTRYLTEGRDGTLYVIDGSTTFADAIGGFDPETPLRGLSDSLSRVAAIELPKTAVVLVTIVLASLLLVAAASALPRPSAYARRLLETPACVAGYAGHVAYHGRRRGDFLAPTLRLKLELDDRLVTLLGLGTKPQMRDLLQKLRERRMSEAEVTEAHELLVELDTLHTRAQGAAPRVSERKFVELVGRGRRILARLDATLPTRP